MDGLNTLDVLLDRLPDWLQQENSLTVRSSESGAIAIPPVPAVAQAPAVQGAGHAAPAAGPRTVRAMGFSVLGCRLAVEDLAVEEVILNTGDHRIHELGSSAFLDLRGTTLPLIDLLATLGERPFEVTDKISAILVLTSPTGRFGLMVETLGELSELQVRSCPRALARSRLFAASAIAGDGKAVHLVDVPAIAEKAGLADMAASENRAVETTEVETTLECLLVDIGGMADAAIPSDQVHRIVAVGREQVEYAGGQPVFQLGNDLIPLLTCHGVLDLTDCKLFQAVLVQSTGSMSALVTRAVRGIRPVAEVLDPTVRKPTLLGTAVVDGRVVDVVDAVRLCSDLRSRSGLGTGLGDGVETRHAA